MGTLQEAGSTVPGQEGACPKPVTRRTAGLVWDTTGSRVQLFWEEELLDWRPRGQC